MPVSQGFELKLKKRSVIPDIPIFACTAFDNERDKDYSAGRIYNKAYKH